MLLDTCITLKFGFISPIITIPGQITVLLCGVSVFPFCMAKCIYLMKVRYCYFFETMWSPDKSNIALIFPVRCA